MRCWPNDGEDAQTAHAYFVLSKLVYAEEDFRLLRLNRSGDYTSAIKQPLDSLICDRPKPAVSRGLVASGWADAWSKATGRHVPKQVRRELNFAK